MVKDISGQRFGRLVAIQPTMMRSCTYVVWECKCDCGNTVLVASNQLRNGNTKSCGCLRKDYITKELTKDLTGQRFETCRETKERICDVGMSLRLWEHNHYKRQ